MKQKILLVAILSIINLSTFAGPSGIFSGADLLHYCDLNSTTLPPSVKKPYPDQQIINSIICSSFIAGFAQGYMATYGNMYAVSYPTKINDKAIQQKMFCLSDSTSVEDIRKIVVQYMKASPDQLQNHAAYYIYAALHQAYPCVSTKNGDK